MGNMSKICDLPLAGGGKGIEIRISDPSLKFGVLSRLMGEESHAELQPVRYRKHSGGCVRCMWWVRWVQWVQWVQRKQWVHGERDDDNGDS